MFLKEFKDLRRKREKLLGMPDQLNYAIPVDDQTIAMKDGAFLSAFTCLGLDLNSASCEELDAHRAQANRALLRLDDGFMYNVDLVRRPSVDYPSRTFPDAVSATLDREREIQYSAEGRHFETDCVLAITYRPPADVQTKVAGIFLSGAPNQVGWRRQLDWFKRRLREFEDAISPLWKLTPLDLPALLSHLATCINGRMVRLAAPRGPIYLDAVIGNQDFIAGFKPRVGGRHIRVVARQLPTFLLRRDGCVPQRAADLLPLLGSRHSGRIENGRQSALYLPAELVSEAPWTARRDQRALRLGFGRSLPEPARA
jgi:hypothetical protein